jgi:phosphoribosylamine--glycine ligase
VSTRILVVGGGGREHALAWKLAQSPSVDEVVCAPGNPGMEAIGECVAVDAGDGAAVADLADKLDAALVVVGPEDPLVAGVADAVRTRGRVCFGPSAAAASLEGSKAFMKDVLVTAGVPTARHAVFTAAEQADAIGFLDTLDGRFVVKTDGLAAGKGVLVTGRRDEAIAAVRSYTSGEAFGDAGRTCVIEERLDGQELSVFALCAGTDAIVLGCAQDHKRIGDGDTGPNTGGMGAFSPVHIATDALVAEAMDRAVLPTLDELARRGAPYQGVLFCGLMLTTNGPVVLEHNVRFGDPECQVLVRRVQSDLFAHLHEAATGKLVTPVQNTPDAALVVVLASEGYPAHPRSGDEIHGLDAASARDGVEIFHAGTRRDGDALVTSGGRVLGVTAIGVDAAAARAAAYAAVGDIGWDGMQYRRDIAHSEVQPPGARAAGERGSRQPPGARAAGERGWRR